MKMDQATTQIRPSSNLKVPTDMSVRWILGLVTLGAWLLWAYFFLVFAFGNTFFGITVRMWHTSLLLVVSAAAIYWLVRELERRRFVSPDRLKKVALACMATFLSVMGLDTGYGLYSNWIEEGAGEDVLSGYYRSTDEQLWVGEIRPRVFYPTERNFQIHKPNFNVSATVYGSSYSSRLLESQTLADSVLEAKLLRYTIDEHGFRETTPLGEARIFALGDSFTEGFIVNQENTWVELLEDAIGEPVYNLGVSDSSPKQQLMLLDELLRTKEKSVQITHLLWMIFEGNDLEDSYETFRPIHQGDNRASILTGTILSTLSSVPELIKHASVINRLMTHRITTPEQLNGSVAGVDSYIIDGVRLRRPVYYSELHGYRMFHPSYITRAAVPESYVMNHPNRTLLDETFSDMQSLSKENGFRVTVLIAPSGPRVYAQDFEYFPSISKEPHFINYVEDLATRMGFGVINLYTQLRPYAATELLYVRDDTHWNERGNEIVAGIINSHLGAR